jgi:hypothetical protein
MRGYLKEKVAAPVYKTEINGRGGSAVLTTRRLSIRKSWHENWPTSGGRSVGIVHLRTKGDGIFIILFVHVMFYVITACTPHFKLPDVAVVCIQVTAIRDKLPTLMTRKLNPWVPLFLVCLKERRPLDNISQFPPTRRLQRKDESCIKIS